MFTRPGVEPTAANSSDWRKSSTAVSDSNVYTPPKIPSAWSASQTFEASPGTAAKAGATSSHELANSSSESPSRLKFTIRMCIATSFVRAGGPQDDYEVPPSCADEDLMRIRRRWWRRRRTPVHLGSARDGSPTCGGRRYGMRHLRL